jgi:hypothetical protein
VSLRLLEPKNEPRHRSLEEQARALAVILREEFGVPFALFNIQTGAPIRGCSPDNGNAALSGPPDIRLDLAAVHEITSTGRARVVALPGGRYQLALLLYEGRKPTLVAAGEIQALAKTASDVRREQMMLEKWVQSVSDRLRLADQLGKGRRRADGHSSGSSQNLVPWEALLALDHLTRKLRLHKEGLVNYKRVLETAFGFVGAQALVWVPRSTEEHVLVQGDACLSAAESRLLANYLARSPDFRPPAPIFYEKFQDQPDAGRFPEVESLIGLPVMGQGLAGWVIAINKEGARGKGRGARNQEAAARDQGSAHGNATPEAEGNSLRTLDAGPLAPRPSPLAPSYAAFRKADVVLLTPFVALLELYMRSSTRYRELKDLLVGLTRSLTTAIDAKDTYTYGHSERVARIAVELGRELGLGGDELGDIYLTGLLHDVGKIGIRDDVLRKPGKLTPEEQDHIQQHVTIGYSILAELRQIRNLLPGVLYHHERYDGKGYPDGLAGENIPLLARILAVADAYDAMTTARPYREPMPWRKVEQILSDGAGTQWDQRVVEAFQRCRQKIHTIRQRGVGESLRQAIEGALRDRDSHHGFAPAASVKP